MMAIKSTENGIELVDELGMGGALLDYLNLILSSIMAYPTGDQVKRVQVPIILLTWGNVCSWKT